MVKTLTSKFKVETVWPELVNKRIHQIESHLKEIQFLNRAGSLVAKGSFKRQVKYVDSDGKFRKAEDKLQFEVVMDDKFPEPLPFFTTELKTDYFIFQPRHLGENQALLEQGFSLIFNGFEVADQESCSFLILTDLVAGEGRGETVCSLPVNLKRGSRPKNFNGVITFDRGKPPVVTGRLTGTVIYRNSHNIIKEQEVSCSLSFLINPDQRDSEGELIVNGSITDVDWAFPTYGQGWKMEIKLDYNWQMVNRKELAILGQETGVDHSDSTIKADILVKEELFKFPKNLTDDGGIGVGPFEVEPVIKQVVWKRIGSGLLISATLDFELFLSDESGMEKYRTICFETEELVEHFFENFEDQQNLTLNLESNIDLKKINQDQGFFSIETLLIVSVKMYQPRVISLVQENAVTEIIGLVPAAEDKFAFLNEAILDLSHQPRKIIKVCNRLSQINPNLKKGWLNIDGVSEATVVYLDRLNQYREESFHLSFQKKYYWETAINEQDYQIDLDSKLEYETFKIEGNQLLYKYLWNFSAALFIKRRVLAAVSTVKKSLITSTGLQPKPKIELEEFSIQGEVPLEFGNPREIAASRALITEFNWRAALNAVLVEGKINSEIEYWDVDGFLRREKLEFPFWTFLQPKSPEKEEILFPRLRRFSYFPLKPWPWRKGSVRYEMDIEINHNPNEGD